MNINTGNEREKKYFIIIIFALFLRERSNRPHTTKQKEESEQKKN